MPASLSLLRVFAALPCGLPVWLLTIALGSLVAPGGVSAQPDLRTPEVPFLTIRNRTGDGDPGNYYGDARSQLRAGICRVRAPEMRALVSIAESVPAYLSEDFLSVDSVQDMPPQHFLSPPENGADAAAAGPRLLYVHGFNISFEKGCRRAALVQQNARLDGRMLWFSWPSDGAMTNYTRDESDLYWSVPDLVSAIHGLSEAGAQGPDMMAHSLGARGLVLALHEIGNRQPDAALGQVVLLAPDIDFDIFTRMLPRIVPIVAGITVYVTDGDRPLAVSEQLHGYPRLGQAGNDVSGLDSVEVIDLSALPVTDLTGHVYHVFSPEVGADLDRLLNEGLGAAERPGLTADAPNLWRLLPSDARITP